MTSETRNCQNCKQDFTIEPEDFDFYKKIDAPPPTFCPKCRLQRRLAWFKGFRLYKRKCDLCGKEKISMYRPDAPYTIYCPECWWSDKWNPEDYARDYDFSKPFFEQFNEQLHKVPLMGLAISKEASELSPFTNHCDHSKNCYLIFYSDYQEDVQYGFYLADNNKSLLDCSITFGSTQCYDTMNSWRNNRVHGSRGNVHTSIDCFFIKDSRGDQHCFGTANIYNKKYVMFNEQLTKEEYERRMKDIDLGSYKMYQEMKTKAERIWKESIPYPYYQDFDVNCTGNYVFNSKNCRECYECGYCEDSKYLMLIKNPSTKDSYDYTDWGEGAERIYEGITVGNGASDVKFSQDVHSSHNVEYSKSCMGSGFLFGCTSLRSKEYYILNKKYSKGDFHAMREKIIKHMKEKPYADAAGRKYEYGEFFPPQLSPHDYNDTFAHMFYPLEKSEALKESLSWVEISPSEHVTTKNAADLPDHIRDAKDDILNEAIKCTTCPRGFRITHQELQFLRQHNFPLPRRCPFCRIEEKAKRWAWQMTLVERNCDKCEKLFRTNYRKEDAAVVYCKECYLKEIF